MVALNNLHEAKLRLLISSRQSPRPHSTQTLLDLAKINLLLGRIGIADQWLHYAEKRPLDTAGQFAAACVKSAIHYEQYHGAPFKACLMGSEINIPSPPGYQVVPALPTDFPSGLINEHQKWCSGFFAILVLARIQYRIKKVELAWSTGDQQSISTISQHLSATQTEMASLTDEDSCHTDLIFAYAKLVQCCRVTQNPLEYLPPVLRSSSTAISTTLQAWIHLLFFDLQFGPPSCGLTWNLAIQTADRESNELPGSVEGKEFGDTRECHYGQIRLDQARACLPESLDWAARQICIQIELRQIYLCMLNKQYQQAFDICQKAVTLAKQGTDNRLLVICLIQNTITTLACYRGDRANQCFDEVVNVLNKSASRSWALSSALMVTRWGRTCLTRRGAFSEAALSFYFSFRIARQFGLDVLAAQNQMDIAQVDEACGFRQLSGARIRYATLHFMKKVRDTAEPDQASHMRSIHALHKNALMFIAETDLEGLRSIREDMLFYVKADHPASQSETAKQLAECGLGVQYAQHQERFIQMCIVWLRIILARRKGDDAQLQDERNAAQALLSELPEGEQAYWRVQFNRESGDIPAAQKAVRNWAELNNMGSILETIAQYLEDHGGELANNEKHVGLLRACSCFATGFNNVQSYQEALEQLRLAEQLGGKNWFDTLPQYRLIARLDTAMAHLGAGKNKRALQLCLELIEMYEELESLTGDATRILTLSIEPGLADAYAMAAAALHNLGSHTEALEMAEVGRSRALKHILLNGTTDVKFSSLSAETSIATSTAAWQPYSRSRLSAKELSSFPGLSNELIDSPGLFFQTITPDFLDVMRQQQSAIKHWAQQQTALATEFQCAIISFSLVGNTCLSFSVGANERIISHRMKTDSHELEYLISRYLWLCTHRESTSEIENKLGLLLLFPHQKNLVNSKTVFIVPHGDLFRLPLHALPWKAGGQALIHTHAVCFAPATVRDPHPDRKSRNNQPPLVIGRPDRKGDSIDIELSQVASSLGVASIDASSLSKEALPQLFDGRSLIHIAAHGHTDIAHPWNSGLHLTDDELLTAADIGAMNLDVDLVTLGACSTGSMPRARHDITSFSRALLSSGAGACLVTAWDVNSESTAALMSRFYQEALQGAPPIEALQSAQRFIANHTSAKQNRSDAESRLVGVRKTNSEKSRRDWSHPYFWAGFVLVGWIGGRSLRPLNM